jgi:signal peptidase I
MIKTEQKTEAIQELLHLKRVKVMTISGGSMLPTFRHNQKVKIMLPKLPVKIGRCYVFLKGDELLIHRLVAIRHKNVILIGDNNRYPEVVTLTRIIGEPRHQPKGTMIKIICLINLFFLKLFYIVPYITRQRIFCLRLLSKLY